MMMNPKLVAAGAGLLVANLPGVLVLDHQSSWLCSTHHDVFDHQAEVLALRLRANTIAAASVPSADVIHPDEIEAQARAAIQSGVETHEALVASKPKSLEEWLTKLRESKEWRMSLYELRSAMWKIEQMQLDDNNRAASRDGRFRPVPAPGSGGPIFVWSTKSKEALWRDLQNKTAEFWGVLNGTCTRTTADDNDFWKWRKQNTPDLFLEDLKSTLRIDFSSFLKPSSGTGK